jgi:hypothetical protein
MPHNLRMVPAILSLAEKKGVTPAQLCIAWVAALGPHVIPLPGSSSVSPPPPSPNSFCVLTVFFFSLGKHREPWRTSKVATLS